MSEISRDEESNMEKTLRASYRSAQTILENPELREIIERRMNIYGKDGTTLADPPERYDEQIIYFCNSAKHTRNLVFIGVTILPATILLMIFYPIPGLVVFPIWTILCGAGYIKSDFDKEEAKDLKSEGQNHYPDYRFSEIPTWDATDLLKFPRFESKIDLYESYFKRFNVREINQEINQAIRDIVAAQKTQHTAEQGLSDPNIRDAEHISEQRLPDPNARNMESQSLREPSEEEEEKICRV